MPNARYPIYPDQPFHYELDMQHAEKVEKQTGRVHNC